MVVLKVREELKDACALFLKILLDIPELVLEGSVTHLLFTELVQEAAEFDAHHQDILQGSQDFR